MFAVTVKGWWKVKIFTFNLYNSYFVFQLKKERLRKVAKSVKFHGVYGTLKELQNLLEKKEDKNPFLVQNSLDDNGINDILDKGYYRDNDVCYVIDLLRFT